MRGGATCGAGSRVAAPAWGATSWEGVTTSTLNLYCAHCIALGFLQFYSPVVRLLADPYRSCVFFWTRRFASCRKAAALRSARSFCRISDLCECSDRYCFITTTTRSVKTLLLFFLDNGRNFTRLHVYTQDLHCHKSQPLLIERGNMKIINYIWGTPVPYNRVNFPFMSMGISFELSSVQFFSRNLLNPTKSPVQCM